MRIATFFIILCILLPNFAYSQNLPHILSSYPNNNYIDPRADRDRFGEPFGLTEFQITFSKPVRDVSGANLSPDNFVLLFFRQNSRITTNVDLDTPDNTPVTPSIVSVTGSGAGPYILNLSTRLPLLADTVIQTRNIIDSTNNPLVPSNGLSRIILSSLPYDIDNDRTVTINDLSEFLIHLQTGANPLYVDIDRDGAVTSNDITASLNLITGLPEGVTYQPWSNKTLKDNPESFMCNENREPVAIISAPSVGDIDESLSLSASNSYDINGVIVSYEWNMGDGTKKIGPDISHSYSSAGLFTTTLSVTDHCGSKVSISKVIPIETEIPLNADFSFLPDTPKVFDTVTFTPEYPYQSNVAFDWTIIENGQNPYTTTLTTLPFVFFEPGEHFVSLTARNLSTQESKTVSKNITIHHGLKLLGVYGNTPLTTNHTFANLSLANGQTLINGKTQQSTIAWASSANKIITFDITHLIIPPIQLGEVDLPNVSSRGISISPTGTLAASTGASAFALLDATLPESIPQLGLFDSYYDLAAGNQILATGSSAFHNTYLYIGAIAIGSELDSNLVVLNVENPQQPALVRSVPLNVHGVAQAGMIIHNNRWLFLGTFGSQNGNRVVILDLANPSHPSVAATIQTFGGVGIYDMSISPNNEILAVVERASLSVDSYSNVAFFNISNPEQPTLIARLSDSMPSTNTVPEVRNVMFISNTEAVISKQMVLTKVSLSEPQKPRVLESLVIPHGVPHKMAMHNDRIYVSLTSNTPDGPALAVIDPGHR
jgi:hypothetical protein